MNTLSLCFAAHFFQETLEAGDLGMKHLPFLIAAYSAIWLIIAFYIWILLTRNRKLNERIAVLENRIQSLEHDAESGGYSPEDEA